MSYAAFKILTLVSHPQQEGSVSVRTISKAAVCCCGSPTRKAYMTVWFLMCGSKSTSGRDEASVELHDWILTSSGKFSLYLELIPWTFSTVVPPLINAKKGIMWRVSFSACLHFWEAYWNCSFLLSKASFPYLDCQTPNIKTPKQKLLSSDEELHLHLRVTEELTSAVFPDFTGTHIYISYSVQTQSWFNESILFMGVKKYH